MKHESRLIEFIIKHPYLTMALLTAVTVAITILLVASGWSKY